MMCNIYTSGKYLETTPSWHAEDSPWKATQIAKMVEKHQLRPNTIVEIGCGVGVILEELSRRIQNENMSFTGYDISPQAIEIAKKKESAKLRFSCEDPLLDTNHDNFDLLLAIDVVEHVPDYLGFLSKCKKKSKLKIYHIPLDLHVSSILRNAFVGGRQSALGHLHYFTADSALVALRDTDHEIIDFFYTNAAFGLFRQHPSLKRAVANVPRWLFSKLNMSFTARVFGGYSLLVLAR
jgi:SAM-dependent methyltransferase